MYLPIVSEVTLVIKMTEPKTIVDINIDAPINALQIYSIYRN